MLNESAGMLIRTNPIDEKAKREACPEDTHGYIDSWGKPTFIVQQKRHSDPDDPWENGKKLYLCGPDGKIAFARLGVSHPQGFFPNRFRVRHGKSRLVALNQSDQRPTFATGR